MIKTGRARLGRSRSFRVRGSRDLPSGFYFGPGEGVERGARKKGVGSKGGEEGAVRLSQTGTFFIYFAAQHSVMMSPAALWAEGCSRVACSFGVRAPRSLPSAALGENRVSTQGSRWQLSGFTGRNVGPVQG